MRERRRWRLTKGQGGDGRWQMAGNCLRITRGRDGLSALVHCQLGLQLGALHQHRDGAVRGRGQGVRGGEGGSHLSEFWSAPLQTSPGYFILPQRSQATTISQRSAAVEAKGCETLSVRGIP